MAALALSCAMPSRAQDTSVADFTGPYFPYALYEKLLVTSLSVGGGTLNVAFVSSPSVLTQQDVLQWVRIRAQAVTQYFEGLPGQPVKLLLVFAEGAGILSGSSFGFQGAACRLVLGRHVNANNLKRDWVLVHELVHNGFPSVASQHHWMEEGLATYVEPIVQVRASLLSEASMWKDLMAGLPKGLPASGDAGLDHTPTWGRTYWGGALYYFLTDIEIRQRTNNTRSLRDALVALNRAGRNITQSLAVDQVVNAMDEGTGTQACTHMYERMKNSPYDVNLDVLWRELGVALKHGQVVFDDTAPMANVRRAIAS